MDDSNPSIISHLSVGTDDVERSAAFYDAVLPCLGCRRVMEHAGAVAYGKEYPEFWVQRPFDNKPASVGNGMHVAFLAENQAQVNAFYEAALKAGARDEGPPGPRPHYGEPYYACFVRDPDGHKIEAMFWDTTLAS